MPLEVRSVDGTLLELVLGGIIVRRVDGRLFRARDFAGWEVASEQEFGERFCALECRRAFLFCTRRLARRRQHSEELRRELEGRHICSRTVDAVIRRCQDLGFLSDDDLIQDFVRIGLASGKSARALIAKARARGLPLDQVGHHLAEKREGESEALRHWIERRYPELLHKDIDPALRQKYLARLKRKGFSYATICQALM